MAEAAAAGGWSALSSLQTCYMQVDPATMYEVVSSPTRLRETLDR